MNGRSLHRQLLLWLLAPQLVLWLVAAFGAYRLASRHADELVDASLLQSARALARQIKPTASGLFVDLPSSAQDILSVDPADPDERVLYLVSTPPGALLLGDARLPPPPGRPLLNEPVYFDATLKNERLRLVSLDLHLGAAGAADSTLRVQVARSSAPRELLARRMLLDTALPLSLLIALMSMGVWAGIRRGLQPLAELQRQMQGRRADALDPVQLRAAPPEVGALAGAVNELLGQVQHSLATQRRFISDAAHQLRTPLAGLKSQSELALAAVDATADPALRQRLERVHESAVRGARLVSQLLVLARTEPEAVAAQGWAAVDCARLVQEVASEWVPRALAAGCDLGVEIAPGALGMQGVQLLLREALTNLVDNAVRYAGSGATITVKLRRAGDDVWIDVEDNGPGLVPELRERAFERFVRGAPNGEGCGLGLAIVREIAERHGGSAELLPAAPHGCIARLTLPLA
ncbi:sensor histidine kinase [Roseateles saccharophilus]|uniref:histidine kinase n=1 Tax=Roseateles saccharophilus TaxID=304 RepID=A0A4R3UV39_ROSSA|nr:sensor histidine kinase [Roseateles saccharophilus]MDG0833223.1 sensor histidine kinase [Roseateles saccharophilus]TCU94428.1 two-component system sensor histidine kinase TctE [Roseateles saccharophilus]